MLSNSKRGRSTDDYDDRQPARRQKVLDTRNTSFSSFINTSSPLIDQPFSAPPLAAFPPIAAIPSSTTINMPDSFYAPDWVLNAQHQEPGTVLGYHNDNRFREGRDFDLEIILKHNDPRLASPSLYLLQDVGSYQPGDALSHILVAHGQLFLDSYRNLVRIKPRQPTVSATGNINNEVNSDVYNGHIGYIPCPDTADGLTKEEFNVRLEEWAFQVPRDIPTTVAGWSFDAWMALIRSGVRGFDDNTREEIPLQPQQPPIGSYIPVVDRPQALPNNPAYTSDVDWTASNSEAFGSWMQGDTPRVLSQPNLTVPNHDVVHLTPADGPQQPPAPQRRAQQSKAPQQTGAVSQQGQRINPYGPNGLFAQEFSQRSEVTAVHKTPASRAAAILAERTTEPPVVMPAPSERQKGQKQARQTRDSRAAVPASDAQPSRKRKVTDSNIDAQMPSTTLAPNINAHNMMGQPIRSQPAEYARPSFVQEAPAGFNVQAIARPHQRPFIPREALSRSNIADAMDDWNQGEEQFQQQQQAILEAEQYFRPDPTVPNPLARQEYVPVHIPEEFTFEETSSNGFESGYGTSWIENRPLDLSNAASNVQPPDDAAFDGFGYGTSWIGTGPSARSNVASSVQPPDDTFDAGGLEAILEYLNNSTPPAENMQPQDVPLDGTG